jgi:hypothetical protein
MAVDEQKKWQILLPLIHRNPLTGILSFPCSAWEREKVNLRNTWIIGF